MESLRFHLHITKYGEKETFDEKYGFSYQWLLRIPTALAPIAPTDLTVIGTNKHFDLPKVLYA